MLLGDVGIMVEKLLQRQSGNPSSVTTGTAGAPPTPSESMLITVLPPEVSTVSHAPRLGSVASTPENTSLRSSLSLFPKEKPWSVPYYLANIYLTTP